MTFPLEFHIFGIPVMAHMIFDFLAFTVGLAYFSYHQSKHQDVIPENRSWIIVLGAAIGALVGSRLLAYGENPFALTSTLAWIQFYAQQTIVGGIVGGIIGIEIVKKILKIKTRTGDIFVYPLILGMAIGRVGCLLTGVSDATVGLPSSLPWAFDQGDGIPRHPTSLYEIIFLLVLWFVLKKVEKRFTFAPGTLFRLFVVLYLGFRLLVEFIKPVTPVFLNLSYIQIFSLLGMIYYIYELYKTKTSWIQTTI
jgi:phosphatidylglycerol:prolipoprotein diacylglycerol transferase